MDLTKLFLGDALEGIDLGGLSKLGFQMSEGFESDKEDKSQKDSDTYGSEDDEKEEKKTEQPTKVAKEPKQQKLPPTLYSFPDGRKVLELSSLFIPDKTGPARKIRRNMIMFNKAIINADMGRPLAHVTQEQWTQNRRQFVKGLEQARKTEIQGMNSESVLERATADFTFLMGKRKHTQAMMFEKEDPRLVAEIAQHRNPSKRARFCDQQIPAVVQDQLFAVDPPENSLKSVKDTDYKEGASVAELQKGFLKSGRQGQVCSVNLNQSIADMSLEDRIRLRRQIDTHLDAKIDEVLPKRTQIKLSDPLKQCYMFMRSFQAGDLKQAPPKRSQPYIMMPQMTVQPLLSSTATAAPQFNSAMQDFLIGQKVEFFPEGGSDEELINSASSQGAQSAEFDVKMLQQPVPATSLAEEAIVTPQLQIQQQSTPEYTQQADACALPSDAQICQWMKEADLQDAGSQSAAIAPARTYWGETLTCPSTYQLRRDRQQRSLFPNKPQYNAGGGEAIFRLIKDNQSAVAMRGHNAAIGGIYLSTTTGQQLTEDEEIEMEKERLKAQVFVGLQQSQEIKDMIDATEQMRKQLVGGKLSDAHVQQSVSQNQSNSTNERPVAGETGSITMYQDNLDMAFNKNISEAFYHFQMKKKGAELNQSIPIGKHHPLASTGSSKEAIINAASMGHHSIVAMRSSQGLSQEQLNSQEQQNQFMESPTSAAQVLLPPVPPSISDAAIFEHAQQLPKKYAVEIVHAKCVDDLQFTSFEWTQSDLKLMHRPNIQSCFMPGNQGLPQQQTLSIRMLPNDSQYARRRMINSEQYFKDRSKLSVKKGEFCLFEHFDRDPLFVNNLGMATQLNQFVYHQGVKASQTLLDTLPHLGPYGNQILRKPAGQIPLIAQINLNSLPDVAPLRGLTIAENKLYKAPIFYNKVPKQEENLDFFCTIQQQSSQSLQMSPQIFIRAIPAIFSVGQQEPKQEVLCPYGRPWYNFNRQRAQTFICKALKSSKNCFTLNDAFKMFPKFGEQGLKKMLRDAGIEIDRDQILYSTIQEDGGRSSNDHHDFSQLTLEQVCQYESALKAQQGLEEMGISLAKYLLVDKISAAANRFCADEKSPRIRQICRLIEDSVVSAPWNLSSNFLNCRQKGDMLLLEGVGDPSNGHGGYSFLKMPLKVQTDQCMAKAKASRASINPAIKNPKQVTGTDADLRKLTKQSIKQKLLDLGMFNNDQLSKMSRWKMVSLLKDISQQALLQQQMDYRPASSDPPQPLDQMTVDNLKFVRGERMTTKMQREVYQLKVNEIFRRQISYHLGERITELDEIEAEPAEDLTVKGVPVQESIQEQEPDESTQCIFEDGQYHDIKNLKQIPGYEKLLLSKLSSDQVMDVEQATAKVKSKLQTGEISLKCQVLRRTIRSVEDGSYKVVYSADEKLISKFLKRKKSKKAIVSQMKRKQWKQASQIMSLNEISSLQYQQQLHGDPAAGYKSSIQSQPAHTLTGTKSIDQSQSTIRLPSVVEAGVGRASTSSAAAVTAGVTATTRISIPFTGAMVLPEKAPEKVPSSTTVPVITPTKNSKSSVSSRRKQVQQKPQSHQKSQKMRLSSDSEDNAEQLLPSNAARPKKSKKQTWQIQEPSSSQNVTNRSKSKKGSASASKRKAVVGESDDEDEGVDDYQYFQGVAASKTNTAHRRGRPDVKEIFNNHLEDVVDACVREDRNRIFTQRVTEKEAPNYFEYVKNPMDLSVMKGKTKRREYRNLDQFRDDLELLRQNSILYNGPTHVVTDIAKDLERVALKKISENNLDTFEFSI